MQTVFHLSPPVAAGRFFRGATDQGWDQRADVAFPSAIDMRVLSVVAGVGKQGLQADDSPSFVHRFAEVSDVGPRTLFGNNGQDHVAGTVAQDARLGKRPIRGFLPEFAGARPPLHVIPTGVTRLEARAV